MEADLRDRTALDQLLPLGAGRMLGYAEYGSPRGQPIFYFHGWPGSRLEGELLHEAGLELGARIIAVDRPGYGLSTFVPHRKLAAWPRDIHLLANALKIGRFSVLGISGGGPYALACAALLEHRVARAAVVCGVGPLTHADSTLGMQRARQLACGLLRQSPSMISRPLSYTVLRGLRTRPATLIDAMARTLPPADRAALEAPEIRALLAASFGEALRQGVRGPAQDLRIYFAPWGFDLLETDTAIAFWHGEQDVIIPPGMSRRLAALAPRCESSYYPDDGHYSLPIDKRVDVLRWLLTPGDTRQPIPGESAFGRR